VGKGNATLKLDNTVVSDVNAKSLPHVDQNGTVTVQ